jgi:1-aminocyclopropane-1-carboxylate deaminase
MKIQDLKKKFGNFQKVKLMWGTTPIVYAENISKDIGIDLFVKRDDLSGLALGGNKTRKLEFLMGQALKQRYDTVITAGALHSNHALQTAAAKWIRPIKFWKKILAQFAIYFEDRLEKELVL